MLISNWNNLISSMRFATLGSNLKLDVLKSDTGKIETIEFEDTISN